MTRDPSSMPFNLRDRLRDESTDKQADLEAVWALLGTTDPTGGDDPDLEGAWETVTQYHPELAEVGQNGQAGAEEESPSDGRSPRRKHRAARRPTRRRRGRWKWGVAVVFFLLMVGGGWLWRQPVTVTAPAGEQQTVTLPDGSSVDLNSGTTLRYRRGFLEWPFVPADRRRVFLDGEAFFEVATSERPFTVETANAQVTVRGTSFNVRARGDEGTTTEVTLASGRVELTARQSSGPAVVLSNSGQTSLVTGMTSDPSPPTLANVNHVLAWRDEGFAVRDRPLSSVVRELERRYDVPIELHSSVDRPSAPLSLYYPEATELKTILHDLCTVRELNYRQTPQGYEIFGDLTGE